MSKDHGLTISTLPVVTQCQLEGSRIKMVVVIRDPNNVIKTELNENTQNLLNIKFGDKSEEVCNITTSENGLTYFKVTGLL